MSDKTHKPVYSPQAVKDEILAAFRYDTIVEGARDRLVDFVEFVDQYGEIREFAWIKRSIEQYWKFKEAEIEVGAIRATQVEKERSSMKGSKLL